MLGGKCRSCGGKLSLQYPLVELIGAAVLVMNFMIFQAINAGFIYYSMFIYLMLLIAFLDYSYYWIPNILILIGIAAGSAGIPFVENVTLVSAACGAFMTGAGLFIIRLLGYALFRRESLGWGDIKLGFMIGIFLGGSHATLAVFLGFFLPFFSGSA
jgi:leader peptidase (prepilin peptidase)/N-methyltransferase